MAVVPRDADPRLQRSLRLWLLAALALLTLASLGILLSRTLELNGGAWGTLWRDMRLALAATHFGHAWLWRVPALAVAWTAWAWSTRSRRPRPAWVMLPAFALVALTRSSTGHPGDGGDFTLAVWIDWLHLLAAGTWVGSLFGMSLAVFPLLLRARDAAIVPAARLFQRLSTLSGIALALLVACGVYNAIRQLGSVSALWTTRYGVILDVKLVLVLVMILIGAHNRYIKLPRLRVAASTAAPATADARIIRTCARAVCVESLLGLAVVVATAVLLHAMPPADARPLHVPTATTIHAESAIAADAGAR